MRSKRRSSRKYKSTHRKRVKLKSKSRSKSKRKTNRKNMTRRRTRMKGGMKNPVLTSLKLKTDSPSNRSLTSRPMERTTPDCERRINELKEELRKCKIETEILLIKIDESSNEFAMINRELDKAKRRRNSVFEPVE